ncbi:MAG: sigma-70 family RNA polymerase sigma factor [Actinomycetota bacterium]|nr:sigma-70 family RNA polymerase sigma factor [Actinomycetota bacterium]
MSQSGAAESPGDSSALESRALAPDDLVELSRPLRRYVEARVRSPHDVDDIVQETLVRMMEVYQRLEVETLGAYAFTVARNLTYASARADMTARRHLPRMLDPRAAPDPHEEASASEARRALIAALAALPARRRALLVARDLEERPLADLAADADLTPNVLASQLHRTRATLRVDYVLALRGVTLPSPACRPVLIAISAADQRRQSALRAGEHLATCPVCAELAPPLVHRDRALAGVVPWLPLGALHGSIRGLFQRHPLASAAGATTAGVVAAAVVVGVGHAASTAALLPVSAPTTTPAISSTVDPAAAPPAGATSAVASPTSTVASPTSTVASPTSTIVSPRVPRGAVPGVSVNGQPLVPEPGILKSVAGKDAHADRVPVISVPADEGFWVGHGAARIWVQFSPGTESPQRITAGQTLSFTGVVTANTPQFLALVALTPQDGRAELETSGYHLQVDAAKLRILG